MPKLKPKFQPTIYQQIVMNISLKYCIILSPIIVAVSPYLISLYIKDVIKKIIINYKCSYLQKELLKQEKISLYNLETNQIWGQKIENMYKTYPIVISKHKSKECQMLFLMNKQHLQNGHTFWGDLQRRFQYRKEQKKQSIESMLFFAGTQLLNSNLTLIDIYNKWKSQDNILYIRYEVIEVFG